MATVTDGDDKEQQQVFNSSNRSPTHVKFSENNINGTQQQNSTIQDDLSSTSRQGL